MVLKCQVNTREAVVKNELEKVRDWAEARIKSGNVPDWSWQQHVTLIEALDAMLHDISVSNDPPGATYRPARNLRLVERIGERNLDARREADAIH